MSPVCDQHQGFAETLAEIKTNTNEIIVALNGPIGHAGGLAAIVEDNVKRIGRIEARAELHAEKLRGRVWEIALKFLPWAAVVCLYAFQFWLQGIRK